MFRKNGIRNDGIAIHIPKIIFHLVVHGFDLKQINRN